jgi:hypothetical protein
MTSPSACPRGNDHAGAPSCAPRALPFTRTGYDPVYSSAGVGLRSADKHSCFSRAPASRPSASFMLRSEWPGPIRCTREGYLPAARHLEVQPAKPASHSSARRAGMARPGGRVTARRSPSARQPRDAPRGRERDHSRPRPRAVHDDAGRNSSLYTAEGLIASRTRRRGQRASSRSSSRAFKPPAADPQRLRRLSRPSGA